MLHFVFYRYKGSTAYRARPDPFASRAAAEGFCNDLLALRASKGQQEYADAFVRSLRFG